MPTPKKYLDYEGLSHYHDKLKGIINDYSLENKTNAPGTLTFKATPKSGTATSTDITIPTMVGVSTSGQEFVAGKQGLVPAPAVTDKDKFLKGDGNWATPNNTTYTLTQDSTDGHKLTFTPSSGTATTITIPDNNTWTQMVGATSSANGTAGYVSAPPSVGYNTKFLGADGTWKVPTGTTYQKGTGIDITNNVISNTGVTAVTASTGTNGTINVTTNGTTTEVAVKGLGSAAYTASTNYATATQGGKADSAIQGVKVNNTALTPDSNKIVSITVPTTAADVGAIATTAKGANGGVAELDSNGKVPTSQLPSYVDDVLEYASTSAFPSKGETGKIYVALNTNLIYRWSGTGYVEISPSLALGTTSSTAFRGDYGETAYNHATDSSRLTTATASGLFKVASTAQGHIASLTAIKKTDITGLGIPSEDTTYTFATGDNNGQIKVTASTAGATAQNISVAGLNNAAYKNVDTSISASSTSANLPTSKAVATFVEGKGYTTNTGTVIGSSLTADTIITGNGGVNIKTSSKTIATSVTNVDTAVPTSKAVKTYVDGLVANATHFKGGFTASGDGTIDGGSTTLKSVAEAVGDMYTCTTAGTIYGIAFEVGDSIIFKKEVAAGTAPVSTDLITVEGETSVSVVVPSSSSVTWNTEKTIATVEGTDIKVTIPSNPVPSNNVTGSGTNGYIAKWSGTNTVTNGPQFGSDTTKYLRNDGSWVVPPDNNTWTAMVGATSSANGSVGYVNAVPPKDGYNTKYLRADGTWTVPPDNNTWTAMVGATSSANGSVGYVNAVPPKDGYNTKYLRADGTWTVPPDNDTKNTAGSTDTSSKIFLVGATSQAASPQTYSDNEVFTTSGVLTTKKVQVGGGSGTMEYNSTTQSIDFVFA